MCQYGTRVPGYQDSVMMARLNFMPLWHAEIQVTIQPEKKFTLDKEYLNYLCCQRVTLLGMWLTPVVFCVKFEWWRFIAIWAVFSVITGLVVFKATRKPLGGYTPR